MVIGFDVVSCGDHVPSMLYITILPILAVSFEITTELKSVNVAVHVRLPCFWSHGHYYGTTAALERINVIVRTSLGRQ